ncbi:hypothetical protein BROOK1789B_1181 [Bathymodiolus brooksi thiotrophic gill symbiont]|nr:hypothetical protein BROOK1789B_1181 [Bathymodiolus brooksi thiotrophic gill symbiont]
MPYQNDSICKNKPNNLAFTLNIDSYRCRIVYFIYLKIM